MDPSTLPLSLPLPLPLPVPVPVPVPLPLPLLLPLPLRLPLPLPLRIPYLGFPAGGKGGIGAMASTSLYPPPTILQAARVASEREQRLKDRTEAVAEARRLHEQVLDGEPSPNWVRLGSELL